MAEIIIHKNGEKILLWLYRQDKTITWLAEKLDQTKQGISQKIKKNSFTDKDISIIKKLGCHL